MNFHIDNFAIVDKVIDTLVPQSDVDHTCTMSYMASMMMCTPSFATAMRCIQGKVLRHQRASNDLCEDFHQPQEHEAQQFEAYQELEELVSQPGKIG